MKITVGHYTNIDWAQVASEIEAEAQESVKDFVELAKETADSLKAGETKTLKANVGKITIRRAKD